MFRLSALALLLFTVTPCAAQQWERTDAGGGLVGHLYRPLTPGPHPGILLLGGSGGGIDWQDEIAELLAARGFAALALAYFNMEGLPPQLERIPLEYVEHGLTYLRLQQGVDTTRVGVAGVSKGGELALLLASQRPEVRAVAVFVPSGVVFQSVAEGFPLTSSWSRGGQDVTFVPYGQPENPSGIIDFYVAGLAQADSTTLAAATIPVERIHGPVLLLTGRADNLWPSSRLGEIVMDRLDALGFSHAHEHIAYDDAGHLISNIREEDVSRRGGTDAGNRHAQVDAQRRFLDFWERTFLP